MSRHRRERQRERDRRRHDATLRHLVVLAEAADPSSDEAMRDLIVAAAREHEPNQMHPRLLHEHHASDHPLVTDPIHPHVLTHDAGDDDEQ